MVRSPQRVHRRCHLAGSTTAGRNANARWPRQGAARLHPRRQARLIIGSRWPSLARARRALRRVNRAAISATPFRRRRSPAFAPTYTLLGRVVHLPMCQRRVNFDPLAALGCHAGSVFTCRRHDAPSGRPGSKQLARSGPARRPLQRVPYPPNWTPVLAGRHSRPGRTELASGSARLRTRTRCELPAWQAAPSIAGTSPTRADRRRLSRPAAGPSCRLSCLRRTPDLATRMSRPPGRHPRPSRGW